jgi:hypothetical protein
MEQMAAMASLVLEGALNVTRAFGSRLESGTGWLPYWLARSTDTPSGCTTPETAGLSLTPSEYFTRQCMISTDPTTRWRRGRCRRWAPTTSCGPVTSRTPTPCTRRGRSFLNESAEHGLDGAELDAVLWDTPVGFYRLEDRFNRG